LSLGVSGGFAKYGIDPSLLSANDTNDPRIPEGKINVAIPNLNTGIFFHNDIFYGGISIFNMIGRGVAKREDVALAYHDFHYFFNAGALFKLNPNVQFKPSFLIKQVKGSPINYDLNAMFFLKDILWIGGSFRSNTLPTDTFLQEDLSRRNAVAAIFEVFATYNLRLGYSYDHNLNVLNNYRNNSHEISLGYYLRTRNTEMKNPRWF
jgi:type IX secretion system PorP/SprF family membrane protein